MELKDIIHFYLGSPVLICKNILGEDVIEPLTRKMLYEDIDIADMFFDPEDESPYRLILHRLSDMNYTQLLAFAQADNYYNFSSWDLAVETGKNIIKSNQFRPQAIQWLLSNHFDLFSLIESGQAIDAATITKQQ